MNCIDRLNTRFAIPGKLNFSDSGSGLPVADICTPHATARMALQGAQVLAWQPNGQRPVMWQSGAAVFQSGKSVRGGVPVCWPWFGARAGQAAHGFARNRLWSMRETTLDPGGALRLRLGLQDDAATRALWDFAFDLELMVTVGASLTIDLTSHNTGPLPFTLTDALHSYFCVGDIAQTSVLGLEGCDYLDKVHESTPGRQTGALRFDRETDRVYINTTADCVIQDRAWGRSLRIAKRGSSSTVVWNPWTGKEKTFTDMIAGEYQGMVCVETSNAGPDQVTLLPGERHTLSACISID